MQRSTYWWRYVLEADAEEVEARLAHVPFRSEGQAARVLLFRGCAVPLLGARAQTEHLHEHFFENVLCCLAGTPYPGLRQRK